jgi:hypothetical protein
MGSLTSSKANPKDVDILITIDDETDLTLLATAARRLKGMAQTKNKGADVFLANPSGKYIGRIAIDASAVQEFAHLAMRFTVDGDIIFMMIWMILIWIRC